MPDDGANGLAGYVSPGHAGYRDVDPDEAVRKNRSWWDENAEEYLAEHGEFLGDADFVWCPEGLREAEVGLLGEVAGRRVLEVGGGAAQCAWWLAAQGADVVSVDLSLEMLKRGMGFSGGAAGPSSELISRPTLVQADARQLPFADHSFDIAFSAYGALPFIEDSAAVHREVHRVLKPGGRWIFSVTHPIRWAFPDSPDEDGLTAFRSYFDRTPYVESDENGQAAYAEYHRTLGDRVRELAQAGFVIEDLIEPEWPEELTEAWGGWSPLRGALIPGTTIWLATKIPTADPNQT